MKIKSEKGITLITLAAVVIIIMLITGMLVYNVKESNDVKKLMSMYSDIDNLKEKVSNYYLENGQIPTISRSGLDSMVTANLKANQQDNPIGANDTDTPGKFLILDLKQIDGLSLNYGRDYEKVKGNGIASISEGDDDIYIINTDSYNIFYLRGIRVDGHTYFTNQEKDTEAVILVN